MNSSQAPQLAALGRRVRVGFGAAVEAVLESLSTDVRNRLRDLVSQGAPAREARNRRDAFLEYERFGRAWIEGAARALRDAADSGRSPATGTVPAAGGAALSLIDDGVVENQILASRLAMAVQEQLGFEYNDILLRLEEADGMPVQDGDVLRPEVASAVLVEQWLSVGLGRDTWKLVADIIQQGFAVGVSAALRAVDQELIANGVLPSIDLSQRVRRGVAAPARLAAAAVGGSAAAGETAGASLADQGPRHSGAGSTPGAAAWGPQPDADKPSPLARARARAQGLVGQLRQLLSERGPGEPQRPSGASASLRQAIGEHAEQIQTQVASRQATLVQTSGFHFDDELVQEVAGDLRSYSTQLKRSATTSSEKAVIEIVALIFQSILAEERIPPSVRLWFARLQMPVLRIALAEPEFFETLQHPARQLIDRMGACVLGFDASRIGGSALETEIRRLVQMIEQYPDAGRRAFELACNEFQAFLGRYLTGSDSTRRVVSVAQQVEQKETMAVRYTIELRKMLEDVPVRDEIRDFLFKVWAEVLAVAAVRHGPQDEATQALRRSASELVWAASAKPSRSERSQVIQQLPQLLQSLRQGMALMGLDPTRQESHIKVIGDTLADAFQSKTAAIPRSRIDAIARRLASIEDFVGDDSEGELPLVAESIEMMLGLDREGIHVITGGGEAPNAAMQAWVREIEAGQWFKLDHNGHVQLVQYAWRSERGQLHLLALAEGRSFLFQAGRLAAYLQAGLLVPIEDESLTVRATRDALARLDANPERLLSV